MRGQDGLSPCLLLLLLLMSMSMSSWVAVAQPSCGRSIDRSIDACPVPSNPMARLRWMGMGCGPLVSVDLDGWMGGGESIEKGLDCL